MTPVFSLFSLQRADDVAAAAPIVPEVVEDPETAGELSILGGGGGGGFQVR